jgi:hypothetical protein
MGATGRAAGAPMTRWPCCTPEAATDPLHVDLEALTFGFSRCREELLVEESDQQVEDLAAWLSTIRAFAADPVGPK